MPSARSMGRLTGRTLLIPAPAPSLAQATLGRGEPQPHRALPAPSRWLDMPSVAQSGNRDMPHVAAPSSGRSARSVVAPGHEERATPLSAGPARHVLTLSP